MPFLLVTIMVAILYRAAPNAKVRGLRWVTPGSFPAPMIRLTASAAFAVCAADFGSHKRTIDGDSKPRPSPPDPTVRRGRRPPPPVA